MSWEASTYVLGTKVGQASRKLILLGYANHAHKDGTAAFPSLATVAEYAECSVDTAKRAVKDLVSEGFMREGDQRLVEHYDANKRPIVYDLSMDERQRAEWAAVADSPEVNPLRARAAAIGKSGAEASARARKAQVSGGGKMPPQEIPSTPAVGGGNMPPRAGGGIQNGDQAAGVASGTRGGGTGATQTIKEPPATTNPPSSTAPQSVEGTSSGTPTASPVGAASGQEPEERPTASKRGTRLAEDFATTGITPDMVEWARRDCPDVDGRRATESFVDFWTSKPGAGGLKLDWVKTWRNWMRTDQDRAASRRGRGGRGPAYSDDRTWGQRPGAQGSPAEPAAVEEDLETLYGLRGDGDPGAEQTGATA